MSIIDDAKGIGSKVKGGAVGMTFGFVGDAFNVITAAQTYKGALEEGEHPVVAASKGVMDFAVGEAFYGAMGFKGMLLGTGISIGTNLLTKSWEHGAEMMTEGYNQQSGIGSGHFNLTKAGYTMRQRSLNAIRSNGVNINSAFGNEARNYYIGL